MSPLTTKNRNFILSVPASVSYSLLQPSLVQNPFSRKDSTIQWSEQSGGTQSTESESHHYDSKLGHYDSGGPFYSGSHRIYERRGSVKDVWAAQIPGYYSGPVCCPSPTAAEKKALGFSYADSEYGPRNEDQMKIDGTNAISYSAPSNPATDLGTGLAELYRDGSPSIPGIQLWQSKTKALRGLGSEYLNYQFGWFPLVDEVRSTAETIRTSHGLMQSYQSREGGDTHRRFSYPSSRVVQSLAPVASNSGFPGSRVMTSAITVLPVRQVTRTIETKRWFSGDFTYALPELGKMLGLGSNAYKLFGIALTPDVLWNLAPWSWAADWFSNAGEVINNITNFGLAGLVMKYGFAMEETIDRCEAVQSRGTVAGLDRLSTVSESHLFAKEWPICSSGVEIVTKRRLASSPFGFSVEWEGLSPTQLAITTALGLTRAL